MSRPRTWPARSPWAVALGFVVGAELGLLGSFASEWTIAGWWSGAVTAGLADLVLGALLAAARVGRRPVVAAVVGWLLPVAYFAAGRAEGDVVLRAAPRGYAFLLLGAAGFLPGSWLAARRPAPASASPASPSRR